MEVVTLLKDQDLLNNRILRSVAEYSRHVSKMSPSELSFFVQVFTSDEMQTATSIGTSLPAIEAALMQNADKFSVEEFARVANVVRSQANRDEECFLEFLETSLPYVKSWMSHYEIQNTETLIQIVGAFSETSLVHSLPREFVEQMQQFVMQSAGTFNHSQAVDLAAIMYPYASTELMEVLDRIIGPQHANLTTNEAFDALMAFTNAGHAKVRPKIIQVLFKRLSHDYDRLSTSQLVLLVDLVAKDSDRDLLAKLELNKFL